MSAPWHLILEAAGLVKTEEQEKFTQWAFGDVSSTTPFSKLPELWNARHGDLMKVQGEDSRQETTKRMVGLWRQEAMQG